jgi:hypothetical protein
MDSWTGVRGMHDRMKRELGNRLPTPRDFINITAAARSTIIRASSAARRMSPMGWRNGSSTGPATASLSRRPTFPGAYEEFSRSLSRNCNAAGCTIWTIQGPTLRENLGLDRPAVGDWRKYAH